MYVYQSVYSFEKKSQLSTSDKFSQTVARYKKERERGYYTDTKHSFTSRLKNDMCK